MKPISLISLGACGATALAGAGVVASHYYGGNSIESYIEKTKKSKNKIFLVNDREYLEAIKTKYQESQDTKKPKDEKGIVVTKDNLVQWCSEKANVKFSNDTDPTYLSILTWCFVNSSNIQEEMFSEGREIYPQKEETDPEWKEAWENYKTKKEQFKLIITGAGLDNLNGSDPVEGGKALHKWCKERHEDKNKKLYEDGMEEIYARFKEWCTR